MINGRRAVKEVAILNDKEILLLIIFTADMPTSTMDNQEGNYS